MQIESMIAQGFRNLSAQQSILSPGVNLILGQNGQGKTNFLELIHFLATLKSFRDAQRKEIMAWGEPECQMKARVLSGPKDDLIEKDFSVVWNARTRKVQVNGNNQSDLVEYFRQIKSVCFCPEDLGVLHGYPIERRQFMDRLVFQCRPKHLTLVRAYQRVLKQRNTLLRQWQEQGGNEPSELGVWTEQMVDYASQLTQSRMEFLKRLNQVLPEQYSRVCGLDHEDGILEGAIQITRKGTSDSYREVYEEKRRQERFRGSSLWGPHLDDFVLMYGDKEARRFASTGQKKTLLLALRLCEMHLVQENFGEAPLLLMDDLSAELDAKRLATLIQFLAEDLHREGGVQAFITTVSSTFDVFEPLGDLHFYRMEHGRMTTV